MKDAVNKDDQLVEAGPDAPKMATCPACGSGVELRSRRTGKNPEDKTWFYRHQRGEGLHYPRRPGVWG
jgi:hypothetical protein